MNPDPSPAGPAPGNHPSAPNRSSNLKSRWKRAAAPGFSTPRPAAATPASFGEVKDITSARETLSGQHAKGYAPGENREQEARSMEPKVLPQVPVQKETPAQERKESPPSATRNEPPPPRREPPPPRQQPAERAPQRESYMGLKPDPANDPAPRRLRTESARPVPVQEYSPSAFARPPEKQAPVRDNRGGRDGDRRESSRDSRRESSSPSHARPHASISAHPSRSKEADKPKVKGKSSSGIVGFIKRIFSGGKSTIDEDKRPSRDSDDDRDDHRSSRDRDEDGDRRDHRQSRHHRSDNRQHRHHSRDGQQRNRGSDRS